MTIIDTTPFTISDCPRPFAEQVVTQVCYRAFIESAEDCGDWRATLNDWLRPLMPVWFDATDWFDSKSTTGDELDYSISLLLERTHPTGKDVPQ